MSKRSWVGYSVLALAVALAVLGTVLCLTLSYREKQSDQRDDALKYETESADVKAYDPCTRLVGIVDQINCILREAKGNREEKRAEYDLQAQQDMAAWAYALLLVSIASTVLSVVGLAALVVSLSLNRIATDAAVNSLEVTRRGFVVEHPPSLRVEQIVLPLEADGELSGHCFIINAGAHTAFVKPTNSKSAVRAQIVVYWTADRLPQAHIVNPSKNSEIICNLSPDIERIEPGEAIKWDFSSRERKLSADQIESIRAGSICLYVVGLIRYADEFDTGDGNHRTLFCRRYIPKSDRYEPVSDPYYEYQT